LWKHVIGHDNDKASPGRAGGFNDNDNDNGNRHGHGNN
jgi:hypothetical protein